MQALATLARAQEANGKDGRGREDLGQGDQPARRDAGPDPPGRAAALLAEGKAQQALGIFQTNAKRFPNQWPVHVGLMRGYAAVGDAKKALEEARLAVKQAPDEGNRKNLEGLIVEAREGRHEDELRVISGEPATSRRR